MPAEEAADEADPKAFPGPPRGRPRRRIARFHDAAHERAVKGSQFAIILLLVGKVERLRRADRLRQLGDGAVVPRDLAVEPPEGTSRKAARQLEISAS